MSDKVEITTKSFLSPLRIEWIDGCDWRLYEGFDYYTEVKGAPIGLIHIPKDFVTDFASIPRGLWNLLPPTGPYGKAAVVHDYLYRMSDWPRNVCDDVLLEGMELLEVNWFKRKLIYRFVRMFGGFHRNSRPRVGEDIAE